MQEEAMTFSARRADQSGMTLIEIMVVIMTIGLVTSITGTVVYNRWIAAQRHKTLIEIRQLGSALEQYRLRFGRFPTTSEGLAALAAPPRGLSFIEEVPVDAWGNPYVYVSPGVQRPGRFDLSSVGKDGEDGNDDDIVNWKKLDD
jgi:general secretion pathway protein G